MKFDMEWYVVFVAFLTSFFAVFLSNGVIVAVPTIASDFAMNNVVQNWVPTIIFLVVAVFTVPAGQLSGKFGVKKSLLAGVIVYLIGSIGCVLSFSTAGVADTGPIPAAFQRREGRICREVGGMSTRRTF